MPYPMVLDPVAAKRQARLIKNREAAEESRRRKKARMEFLEKRVVELERQNKDLEFSNSKLQSRIKELEKEVRPDFNLMQDVPKEDLWLNEFFNVEAYNPKILYSVLSTNHRSFCFHLRAFWFPCIISNSASQLLVY